MKLADAVYEPLSYRTAGMPGEPRAGVRSRTGRRARRDRPGPRSSRPVGCPAVRVGRLVNLSLLSLRQMLYGFAYTQWIRSVLFLASVDWSAHRGRKNHTISWIACAAPFVCGIGSSSATFYEFAGVKPRRRFSPPGPRSSRGDVPSTPRPSRQSAGWPAASRPTDARSPLPTLPDSPSPYLPASSDPPRAPDRRPRGSPAHPGPGPPSLRADLRRGIGHHIPHGPHGARSRLGAVPSNARSPRGRPGGCRRSPQVEGGAGGPRCPACGGRLVRLGLMPAAGPSAFDTS